MAALSVGACGGGDSVGADDEATTPGAQTSQAEVGQDPNVTTTALSISSTPASSTTESMIDLGFPIELQGDRLDYCARGEFREDLAELLAASGADGVTDRLPGQRNCVVVASLANQLGDEGFVNVIWDFFADASVQEARDGNRQLLTLFEGYSEVIDELSEDRYFGVLSYEGTELLDDRGVLALRTNGGVFQFQVVSGFATDVEKVESILAALEARIPHILDRISIGSASGASSDESEGAPGVGQSSPVESEEASVPSGGGYRVIDGVAPYPCHGTETAGSTRVVIDVASDDTLNVRSAAGVGNPVVMELDPGFEIYVFTGFEGDGLVDLFTVDVVNGSPWIMVELPGPEPMEEPAQFGCGWVHTRFLSSPTAASLEEELLQR